MTGESRGDDDAGSSWALFAAIAVSLALIAAGVVLAFYANSIRTALHVGSTTCVLTSAESAADPVSRKGNTPLVHLAGAQARACSLSSLPAGLRLAQLTVKREPASDTLLAALLAAALALVLCGAFFTHVEGITVAGIHLRIRRRDRRDTAIAVDLDAQKRPADIAPAVVESAKLVAQQKAADLRDFAAGRRVSAPIEVSDDRLAELRRGNPLPPALLSELAEQALDEQLEGG
jgi:hypothetical protein